MRSQAQAAELSLPKALQRTLGSVPRMMSPITLAQPPHHSGLSTATAGLVVMYSYATIGVVCTADDPGSHVSSGWFAW